MLDAPYREVVLSNGAAALVDADDYDALAAWKWKEHVGGYASRTASSNKRFVLLLMHRELVVLPEGFEVDHINRNKLDNRKANLRAVPHWINQHNNPQQKNSKSGIRGVCWVASERAWRATLQINGVTHRLGYFATAEEAAQAYTARRDALIDAALATLPPTVYCRPQRGDTHDHPEVAPRGARPYKGVRKPRGRNKYTAAITVGGVYHWLGSYDTPEDAARAYNAAAQEAWGGRAWLNPV